MKRWRRRRTDEDQRQRERAIEAWQNYDYASAVIRVAAAVAAGLQVEPSEIARDEVVEWVARQMREAASQEDLVMWQREIERDPFDPDVRRLVHGMQERVIEWLRGEGPDS